MNRMIGAKAAVLSALAAVLPLTAGAQAQDTWKFGASIYLYLPTISSTTNFPQSGGGSDVGVDGDDVLDNLNAAFMGSLEARKGRWGAFTDLLYVDFGNSRSGTRDITIGRAGLPVGASANVDYDIKGTAWTLAGTYRVKEDLRSPVDVFAGARMLDVKQKLGWQLSGNINAVPLPGRAGSLETDTTNWDAIFGVKGRFALGAGKWFVPYYLDVGTGESNLTWQALGGIGYAFSWGDIVGSWRYLDYKMKSGGNVDKLNFNGPSLAAVFHW